MLNPVPRADGLGALRNRGSAYDGCGFLMPVQRIIGGIEIKDEDVEKMSAPEMQFATDPAPAAV